MRGLETNQPKGKFNVLNEFSLEKNMGRHTVFKYLKDWYIENGTDVVFLIKGGIYKEVDWA